MAEYPITLFGCLTCNGTDKLAPGRQRILNIIAQSLPGFELASVDLTESLKVVLEIPVGEILEGAVTEIWRETATQDSRKVEADATETLPLVDFTVESTHEPKLDVYCDQKRVLQATLEIALTLDVRGAKIVLRHGRIEAMQSASCSGSVSLGLVRSGDLVALGTPEFDLPGEISFVNQA